MAAVKPRLNRQDNSREALELMNKSKKGLLPVVEAENLVGIVRRTDIIMEMYDF